MTTATDTTLPAVTAWSGPGIRARLADLACRALAARYGGPPPPHRDAEQALDAEEVRAYVALISAVHF